VLVNAWQPRSVKVCAEIEGGFAYICCRGWFLWAPPVPGLTHRCQHQGAFFPMLFGATLQVNGPKSVLGKILCNTVAMGPAARSLAISPFSLFLLKVPFFVFGDVV